MNIIKKIGVLLFSIVLLGSCNQKKDTKILRLAHTLDTAHPVHRALEILNENLTEKSKGKLTLQLYPSGQLGGERECLELLQIGSLDITKVSAAVLENFINEYKIFSIPYLFDDREHAFKVFDGDIGSAMLTKGEKFRLRGLTFYDAGSRSFYTKEKPIETPKDLEGLKIRVQKSNMAVAMVNDLGGAPTPISYGELYTALQQGVVDGAENNLPSFYTSKHYEICKYFSLDQHTSVPDVLLIGLDTWDKLNTEEQKWLLEAAKESTLQQRILWAKSEKIALDKIKKAGVRIITPNKKPFQQKTSAVVESFKNQPEVLSIIHQIKALE